MNDRDRATHPEAILTKPLDLLFGGGLGVLGIGWMLIFQPAWLDTVGPRPLALGALLLALHEHGLRGGVDAGLDILVLAHGGA